MANLAFELGFDWNVPAILGVRGGVFPLQVNLVDDDSGTVISCCHPSAIEVDDTLLFRVYDFTDEDQLGADLPQPCALQVLFSTASTIESPEPPFSPFLYQDNPLAQLASTDLSLPASRPSIAYGDQAPGRDVQWSIGTNVVINQPGRFKFRALLTVGALGEQARFYRVDPEMVIGDPGTIAPA